MSKRCVMGDDRQIADEFDEFVDFVLDGRRPFDHFVRDACESSDGGRYVALRVDERVEDFDSLVVDVFEGSDLDDAISASSEACCFEVEDDVVSDVLGCRFVFLDYGMRGGRPSSGCPFLPEAVVRLFDLGSS